MSGSFWGQIQNSKASGVGNAEHFPEADTTVNLKFCHI